MTISFTSYLVLATDDCFATGWNPIGEVLIKTSDIFSGFAVDNDFNMYFVNLNLDTLQKWSPDTKKTINLFEKRFLNSAIFYHSLSRSLYFFYVYKDNPGIYKLVDDSSVPVNVINTSGKGSALNQFGAVCAGLYVNSVGDIFVLDILNYRVVKWAANAISGTLVASGDIYGSDLTQFPASSALTVDEINDVIYMVDFSHNSIIKYTNGSTNGVTVLGGGPKEVFSDVMSEYVMPISVLLDKMGNLLVGERNKITKWTSDIKSSVTIIGQDTQGLFVSPIIIALPRVMTFDKLENLYVYDANGQVVKFLRNATSCRNDLH